MARFCPLFSSSSGNCTYIGGASGGILIDAGVSAAKITGALAAIGVEPKDIGAIFVTHEHSDHINGLRVFAGRHNIKVYASEGTLGALEEMNCLTDKYTAEVITGEGVSVNGMHVVPFHTSHDSRESLGYSVSTPDDRRVTVATDTGIVNEETMSFLLGSDLVMIESNHDVAMLQNGPYPYILKRRILSDRGHLSNEACSKAVAKLVNNGTSRFWLAHLSKENNFPDLAYQTSVSALSMIGASINKDYVLNVAGVDPQPGITVF